MRLLFLSNYYPPASFGGYEQWCQEVAEGMHQRGHEVLVLTSRYRRTQVSLDPNWVQRSLHLEMDHSEWSNSVRFFIGRKARETRNLKLLTQAIQGFRPQVVTVWGMWNLPRSLPALAETLVSNRIIYYMGDYWPSLPSQFEQYWKAPARNRVTRAPKAMLGFVARQMMHRERQPRLTLAHVAFPSHFMLNEFQQLGLVSRNTRIIYGAVDTRLFVRSKAIYAFTHSAKTLSLLYTGRLVADKGVHTTIESLEYLVYKYDLPYVHLTIIGTGSGEYKEYLHELVRQTNLESHVTFEGMQPKHAMPSRYRSADIFLFPSIYQEPFGRVLIEAMASGLPVIGTTVGGAAEILIENETGLTFAPGDAVGLAEQVKRLSQNVALRKQLAQNAQRVAVEKFDMQRMINELEAYAQAVAES